MTVATPRPRTSDPGRSATPSERAHPTTATASGWYDPDGAAWEAEASAFESLHAGRVRPEIRVQPAAGQRDTTRS